MRSKIYKYLLLAILFTLIVTAALSIFIYYQFHQDQVKNTLKQESSLVVQAYEKNPQYLEGLRSGSLRITLIRDDGKVLFDSFKDPESMENHGKRPEFLEAMEKGEGSSVRYSTTYDTDTIYIAKKIDQGVLRVSRDMSNVLSMFRNVLPTQFILLGILFLVGIVLSNSLTRKIVIPITESIDSERAPYDELAPFYQKIRNQKEEINLQLQKEKDQNETVSMILSNMNEGLVIFDKEKKVLMINEAAINILNPITDPIDSHILELTSNQGILDAVEKAVHNQYSSGDTSINDRIYAFFASPVDNKSKAGIVLFLTDRTNELTLRKQREEFTQNVTHELKTPLTTISGFAELLENGMVPEEKLKEFGKTIREESHRLQRLIDDILKISKMETAIKKEFKKIDVASIARDKAEKSRLKASSRDIKIIEDLETAEIFAEEDMISEIIENLLSNAIKYNKDGGKVFISVKDFAENVKITVKDTGIGIKPSERDRIFERFYMADKSRNRKNGSTGLGLAIVRHAVEFHDGRISLFSRVNEGSTFTVYLPK